MIVECQLLLMPKVPQGIYLHSVEVMHCLLPACKTYSLNTETAGKAALLHDLASALSIDELMSYIEIYEPNLLDVLPFEQQDHVHLHGPVGAWMAYEMGMNDPDAFQAIKEHAGAFSNMSRLGQCLYVADNLAPSSHNGAKLNDRLARLFYDGDIQAALDMIARVGPHRSSSVPPPMTSLDRATIPPPAG